MECYIQLLLTNSETLLDHSNESLPKQCSNGQFQSIWAKISHSYAAVSKYYTLNSNAKSLKKWNEQLTLRFPVHQISLSSEIPTFNFHSHSSRKNDSWHITSVIFQYPFVVLTGHAPLLIVPFSDKLLNCVYMEKTTGIQESKYCHSLFYEIISQPCPALWKL